MTETSLPCFIPSRICAIVDIYLQIVHFFRETSAGCLDLHLKRKWVDILIQSFAKVMTETERLIDRKL